MKRLMDYLPELYQQSREAIAFQEAWQPEIDQIWAARDDLMAQLNPNTATWGLSLWEDALGLVTNARLSHGIRRGRVVARLRGMGTTTVPMLKSVIETFCPGCGVSIVEHFGEYIVEIRLLITDHEVEDMDGLQEMLRLIMPAHLAWGFAFRLESTGTAAFGAMVEINAKIEIWPQTARKVEATAHISYGMGAEIDGKIDIWPQMARKVEATSTVTYGASAEIDGKIDIWPLVPCKVETTSAITYGAGADMGCKVELWPITARKTPTIQQRRLKTDE